MHILFLTDNFPPEGNAPATRTYEHAKIWVALGHKVTVITSAPNFPEGRLYDGFENRWYQKEIIEGIEIKRVKTYITANEGVFKRTLDFMSFMVTGFVAGLFVKKVDVIVGTSPQFFTVCAAWAVSFFKRRPFVFELRDIWPASITAVGAMRKSLIIKLLEKLELFLYRRASKIVSVTHAFKRELISRGVEPGKIEIVLNGVNLDMYKPANCKDEFLAKKLGVEGKFVVGYIGTHGLAHGLEKVLIAAEKLRKHSDICFLFVGGGAAKRALDDQIVEKKLSNVISIPRQEKSKMPQIWSLCDVSLISLKDTELFKTVIPSKIFESMGVGLPMILAIPEGEAAEIVKSEECGIIVKPESPSKLAEAILFLYQNIDYRKKLSISSYQAAQRYSRESSAKKFEKILLDLIGK